MNTNEETDVKSLVFSDTIIGSSNRRYELHPRAMPVDACLFDDQDDDEDENMESGFEKGILSTSSPSVFNNEEALRQDRKRSSNMVDGFPKKRKNEKTNFSLTECSENFFGIALHAKYVENETKNIMTHSNIPTPSHERGSSDTDYLQKLVSSSHCWAMFVNISEPCGEHSNGKQSTDPCDLEGAQCTDMDVQNLRKNLTEDIMSLFGFTKVSSGADALLRDEEYKISRTYNHQGSIIQNRCVRRNAQRERVQRMQQKWHSPSTSDMIDDHSRIPPAHRSLDDLERKRADDNPGETLFYDSDPDLPSLRKRESFGVGKKSLPPIDTNASFDSTEFGPCPHTPKATQKVNVLSFECSNNTLNDDHLSFDLRNDKYVKSLVKELTVGKVNLLWHPKQSDVALDEGISPTFVVSWFETGVCTPSTLIQPKLMWRETCKVDIKKGRRNLASVLPHSLEILNIVRILKPKQLDRKCYPYVKSDVAFLIKCCDGNSYLFEAETTSERDWFVCTLKLMVARFASMVFVKDDALFSEFFTPLVHSLQ